MINDDLEKLRKKRGMELSDDDQRNAWIAEHILGWDVFYSEWNGALVAYFHEGIGSDGDGCLLEKESRFCTDRDACAVAEAELTRLGVAEEYACRVGLIVWAESCLDSSRQFQLITATAQQRCTAMLSLCNQIVKSTEVTDG